MSWFSTFLHSFASALESDAAKAEATAKVTTPTVASPVIWIVALFALGAVWLMFRGLSLPTDITLYIFLLCCGYLFYGLVIHLGSMHYNTQIIVNRDKLKAANKDALDDEVLPDDSAATTLPTLGPSTKA